MNNVLAIVLILAAVALPALLFAMRHAPRRRRYALAAGALLCCLIAVGLLWIGAPPAARVAADTATNRPIVDPGDGYVGSDACQSCHANQHASWHASYHRKMTQLASAESVLGDFDTTLNLPGWSFDLYRSRDQHCVTVNQFLGDTVVGREDYQIVMTTGSHHMQVYWYSLGDNNRVLGMFPFTYLTKDRQWVPRNATFLKPPAAQHPNEVGRWNTTCIRCHTTQARMDVSGGQSAANWPDLGPDTDTRVAEFGISCEACHGPGQQHADLHHGRAGRAREEQHGRHATITHPGKLNHRLSAQICGQCHGLFDSFKIPVEDWAVRGYDYRPGQDLDEHRALKLCRGNTTENFPADWENNFWSDGMIRTSGREYNGLAESACFQRGELTCISCHRLHQSADDPRSPHQWANDQLAVGMRGNQACTQCHQEYREADALTLHTRHLPNSSGSNCYNCHMPYTAYGLMKAIRSHQITSPDVAVNLKTGRPIACNQCHLDKPLAWTAERLSRWCGMAPPELLPAEHSVAASVQWLLVGDAGLRALMAWNYGWGDAQAVSGTEWMAPYLGQLLEDPYDLVRYNAYHSLRGLPGFESLQYDFMAGPAYDAQAAQRVLEIWSARERSIDVLRAPAVLIDKDGVLLRDEFNRFLQARDDYPIELIQ